jgi:uncharacterized membrane protein
MLTFLSPLALIGLLSAAIPLVIHLSRSRRTKRMQFSTTRFFTDQFLRSYRMSRLKELWLLACRMAICALFAMALARPLALPRGPALLNRQSRSVVLVIDNSASMSYVEDGASMFERIRDVARSLVDELRPGDTASIVLAGRRDAGPEAIFPEPTSELGDVRAALDSLGAATLGTDLAGAIARAERLVQASAAESKEIYVLSDFQATAWSPDESASATGGAEQVLYFLIQARPREPANLAVTAVQYASARPMVNVPFAVRPHIRNHAGDVQSCDVRLYVDGKKVGEQRITNLQAGRWSVPRFHHTFNKSGWHSAHVEIDDGQIAGDNRRYFAIEVLESIQLLAVNGAPSQVARLDELFFLKAALTAPTEGKSAVEIKDVSASDLAAQDLSGFPLVVLANVGSLPAAAVEKLERFVDSGGGLLVFLGDRANLSFYNDTLAGPTRLHGGLLPGRLIATEGDSGGAASAFVADIDFEHAALAAFADPRFANLTRVTFTSLWGVDPAGSTTLMRANTGSPLLCEKSYGKGRVMLFASTCDRDWTNFPVVPAYLPWVYRLVAYLAQVPVEQQGFFATGDEVPVSLSAFEGVTQLLVKRPDGGTGSVAPGSDDSGSLVCSDTGQPGVYALYAPGREDQSQYFAANLDRYESDLTYLDDVFADGPDAADSGSREARVEHGFRERLPGRPLVAYVSDPTRAIASAQSMRRGIRLWDILLMLALVFALFEPWLANRISMRHYARPQEIGDAVGRERPARQPLADVS